MLCEKCGINTATTHIHTQIGGETREMYLCSKCAAKQGFTSGTDSFAEMLFSMLGDGTLTHTSRVKKCPNCATTFNEIAKGGKVGCAMCYDTFYDELLPYIKRVHGSTTHIEKAGKIEPKTQSVEKLREELKQLINEEKYEMAAVVRDKIKKLEERENG